VSQTNPPSPAHGREPLLSPPQEAGGEGLLAASIYTSLSLTAALVFLAVTLLTGDYTWVVRIGGVLWIFGLCMITLMPIITPLVRDQIQHKA